MSSPKGGKAKPHPPMASYPLVLPLLHLHAVQPLHQAGDALLQAVNGVVLGIVAAEAVPQTAQGLPHQLQVAGLPGEVQKTRSW